ncbi:SOH1-domain-containing protein [Blastocladiella britannica]|nr:SOH1-domain-containing protein [Blastocladiella britannica]
MESPDEQTHRFEMELEFIQLLANPDYLHYLATENYFSRSEFINYLKYLEYWRQPQYAKYLQFPHCLHFLTLLHDASFRASLLNPFTIDMIKQRQVAHWATYRNYNLLLSITDGKEGDMEAARLADIAAAAAAAAGYPVPTPDEAT